MTPNWPEDFELEDRRHKAGTDTEQAEHDDAQALADAWNDSEASQEGIIMRPQCEPLRLCSKPKRQEGEAAEE